MGTGRDFEECVNQTIADMSSTGGGGDSRSSRGAMMSEIHDTMRLTIVSHFKKENKINGNDRKIG